jgi:hypothetical protein
MLKRLLGAGLLRAKQRNWNLFWTGDEAQILLDVQPSASWLEVDQELPVSVKQTIGAQESIVTVFRNPRNFVVVDLLPQGITFDADYFII